MVKSKEILSTQGKFEGLIKMRREGEKTHKGKIFKGSRTTQFVDMVILLMLALVVDPNCIFHRVPESCGFPEG